MVRSTPTGLREGLRLGEFVIGERIGRGGFADVYRAIQPSLGREAVIKVLHSATARRVQLFEQEARLACLLDHPYAAHVYAFGVERDGLMWLAMELVRGISLADWLETKGPIPLKRFAVVFERLCEVVHTAHGAGLVHRDIKPANVMVVTRAGRLMPKLLDFGIATMVAPSLAPAAARPVVASDDSGLDDSTDPQHTNDEPASGTPAYMAPEQWHGHQDHRVDIYALGVLAYRCLTNRAPFAGKTPNELYRAHQQQVVPPLGGEFSPALDEVLGIALAKRPEERYGTALELSTALLTAMGNDPGWIARADAESYLTTAPPHIAACVAQLLAAASLAEACEATQVLIGALAQWLGIVALAAAASLHAYTDHPLVQRLHHESLTPREWLELASALCAPYADHDEDFPIPEMVRWFVDDDGERRPETLVAALAVTRGEMTAFPRDVLARVLRGLRFVCAYTLFLGDDEWSAIVRTSGEGPIWISDGDRNPLFELSPLVAAEPPAPGEAVALFAITGGGRSGAKQVSPPHGYERESGDVWPWIEARFHTGAADRERTIADRLPYRGLATFSAGDAELFFGRTRFVGQLFNRVLLHPFVALTGPSGSGKSSVVQAGLIPRMPDDWITVTMRPGRHPVAAFRTAVSQHLADAVDIVHWLRDARRRLLLVVDQAEELLTLASIDEGRELAAMLSQLVAVGGDRVRIVVTLRHDFIGRADELPEWRELIQHNLVLVTVPTGEELTQMIQGPAGQVGYEFDDPALVADMVAEVADRPGGLPLLSFAASRLWDARDPATQRMTREAYRAMGGVGGALAGYAEEVFATLSTSQQTITRDLMRHLITAAGTRAPARREDLASIAEHANVVVERLITARILVTSERVDGGENITLIHEALIERWPRLVKWRAEDAQGAHHRDELRGAATVWNMHDRDPSYLWRGEALAVYRTWAPRWAGSLTAIESAFGEAGIRATSRARRVRRIGVGAALSGLAAAALVFVVLFGRAESHRRDAEERFTELLADRGRSELVADRPLRALVYLSAAYSRGRDGAGMRDLLAQAARAMDRERSRVQAHSSQANLVTRPGWAFTYADHEPPRSWRFDGTKLVTAAGYHHPEPFGSYGFAVSPSGNTIAAGDHDSHKVHVWDRDGTLLGTSVVTEDALDVDMIRVGGDDLIATRWTNVIALWDRKAHRIGVLGTLDHFSKQRPTSLAFSENASRLVVGFSTGTVELWDPRAQKKLWSRDLGERLGGVGVLGRRVLVTTHAGAVIGFSVDGDEVFHIQAHPTVSSLSVSPDETTFATAGAESSVKLWRTEDGVQVATLPHASEIYFVDYSHDGKVLVAKTNESTATLWDPQRRLLLGRIDAGNELDTALVADGGSAVFTTTRTGLVQVWDLLPDNVVTAFDDHRAEVWSATISQDGKTAATLGADMAVRTWELETGKPIARLDAAGPNGRDVLERIAYLPDGRIAAPYDYGVAIWDVARRLRVGFVRPDFDARTIAVDSRGTRIAVANAIRFGTEPYHVIVWDLAEERVVGRHVTSDEAFDVAFDPTGSRLAIATKGKLLELWDIDQDRVIWRADNRVFDVDFSRDGHYVTASSDDGYARIWNAETGEVVMELKQPGRALAVALSPDASLLATAVTDNRIYLWDVATGKLAGTRVGHDNIINSLVFAPDGSRLVSVGRDRRAIEWSVPSEQRSPAELAATVASKVPFRIVGAELVANDRQP